LVLILQAVVSVMLVIWSCW